MQRLQESPHTIIIHVVGKRNALEDMATAFEQKKLEIPDLKEKKKSKIESNIKNKLEYQPEDELYHLVDILQNVKQSKELTPWIEDTSEEEVIFKVMWLFFQHIGILTNPHKSFVRKLSELENIILRLSNSNFCSHVKDLMASLYYWRVYFTKSFDSEVNLSEAFELLGAACELNPSNEVFLKACIRIATLQYRQLTETESKDEVLTDALLLVKHNELLRSIVLTELALSYQDKIVRKRKLKEAVDILLTHEPLHVLFRALAYYRLSSFRTSNSASQFRIAIALLCSVNVEDISNNWSLEPARGEWWDEVFGLVKAMYVTNAKKDENGNISTKALTEIPRIVSNAIKSDLANEYKPTEEETSESREMEKLYSSV